MAQLATPERTLAYEDEKRKPAAAFAFAGAAGVAASVASAVLADPIQSRSLLTSVERIGDGATAVGSLPSLRVQAMETFKSDIVVQIAAGVLPGIAAVLVGFALTFLVRAARARSERGSALSLYTPIVGGVTLLVGSVMATVASIAFVNEVLGSDRTVAAISGITQPSTLIAGAFLKLVGSLALGLAFVLGSLSAMRVGLLTRFMGIIGIFTGITIAIPSAFSVGLAPIMETFWLIAVGLLFLRAWPGGKVPPAWFSGKPEPWPSVAEERAERLRAAQGDSSPRPPEPADVEQRVGIEHVGSKKRKRKRRG